jgi:Uncharacterized protein conserved in bacteria (DUF2314)
VTFLYLMAACLCCMIAAGCGSTPAPSPPSGAGKVKVADGVWYSLEDGEERHRKDPDTFEIPPREARENLGPGQIVKLMFAITTGEKELVERMWVIVERRDGAEYVGALDNQPASTDKLLPGATIRFQAKHVIAIHPTKTGGLN